MSDVFNIKVNNSLEFKVSTKDIFTFDAVKDSENNYHILQKNKPFSAKISTSNFTQKTYTVKVNNNTYTVHISDGLDTLIQDMGFSVGSTKHINSVKAPMPGLILDVNVNIGQVINEDDPLLVLEAMKMENVICSPRKGIIKSISANKGDAVEKNQLLIEFE
jgi:biotin carboxyl carrier protein